MTANMAGLLRALRSIEWAKSASGGGTSHWELEAYRYMAPMFLKTSFAVRGGEETSVAGTPVSISKVPAPKPVTPPQTVQDVKTVPKPGTPEEPKNKTESDTQQA